MNCSVNCSVNRSIPFLFFAALLIGAPAIAHADLSKKVIAAFKGQIVVSEGEAPSGADDKETIAAIKKAQLTTVTGEKNADDVTVWRFHYTAFLNKAAPTSLKMVFYSDDKEKRYAADQRLDGVDPKSPVLIGDVSITEDDGLNKGRSYVIKLVATSGGKDTTLAQTTLKVN
jgi:hypothetical protein